ncbi:MAG: hypothetical protein MRJ65_17390 [Candidatus Brocadiaceae bacterium]|nr:hypothetical protein [Candidatus Brocadiaceae bacterium]
MKRYFDLRIFIASALLFFLCIIENARSSNVQFFAETENTRLAAQLLIAELQEKLSVMEIDEGPLSDEINTHKEAHLEFDDSRRITHQVAHDWLRDWYHQEAKRILDELDANKPKTIHSWFTKEGRDELLQVPEAIINQNLNSNFNRTFIKVREKVCSQQWNRLIFTIYPGEVEFESEDRKVLANKLEERFLAIQKEPVFKENRLPLLQDIIGPILDDAARQRQKQSDIIGKSNGGNFLDPIDIEKFIEKEIHSYRNSLKQEKAGKKIPNKVYTIFPSTRKMIPVRAKEHAIKNFTAALSGMKLKLENDSVKNLIGKNIPAHTDRTQSWEICMNHFRPVVQKKAIDIYTGNLFGQKKDAMIKFLESCISDNKNCSDHLTELAKTSLIDDFDKGRQELSHYQFTVFFSPLADQTWRPSNEVIDRQYHKVQISISRPLEMKGIFLQPFDPKLLFEETRNKVSETEKKLIGKGVSALKNQMDIVEIVETPIKEKIHLMNAFPHEEDLIKLFISEVELKWVESPLAKKYKELFPRVLEEIKIRSKAILPRGLHQQKQAQTAETTTHNKGHKGEDMRQKNLSDDSSGGIAGISAGKSSHGIGRNGEYRGHDGNFTGTGNKGNGRIHYRHEPDVIIDLDYENGMTRANIVFTKVDKLNEFVFDGRPGMNQQTNIQEHFELWLRDITHSFLIVDLYIMTRIFNQEVDYSTVYDIRSCLEKASEIVHDENINVYWFDKLLTEEDKSRETIFREFKTRSMHLNAS